MNASLFLQASLFLIFIFCATHAVARQLPIARPIANAQGRLRRCALRYLACRAEPLHPIRIGFAFNAVMAAQLKKFNAWRYFLSLCYHS